MIASYFGTLVYREALEPGTDRSYIVRLPDAGGALANGKAFADAIRANPANPADMLTKPTSTSRRGSSTARACTTVISLRFPQLPRAHPL